MKPNLPGKAQRFTTMCFLEEMGFEAQMITYEGRRTKFFRHAELDLSVVVGETGLLTWFRGEPKCAN